MVLLRTDAIKLGFQEAAITYGWSAIRTGFELLDEKIAMLDSK
jgi:hypothetical protein